MIADGMIFHCKRKSSGRSRFQVTQADDKLSGETAATRVIKFAGSNWSRVYSSRSRVG